MKDLKIFVELTRLNKPIGFMLLFWPCSWGLAYAYKIKEDASVFIYYLILFFLGSVLMRSAGCIFNDIIDRNFDKKSRGQNQTNSCRENFHKKVYDVCNPFMRASFYCAYTI